MKKVLIPTKLESDARKIAGSERNYTVIQDDKPTSWPWPPASDTYAIVVRSEK